MQGKKETIIASVPCRLFQIFSPQAVKNRFPHGLMLEPTVISSPLYSHEPNHGGFLFDLTKVGLMVTLDHFHRLRIKA